MNCPKCGAPVQEGTKFCKECGTQIAAMPEATGKPIMPQKYEAENAVQSQGFEAIEYITSYLTFYLKGRVEFTRDNIHFKVPNTVLGLIPLGSQQQAININHVVGASSNFHLKTGSFIVALLGTLYSLSQIGSSYTLLFLILSIFFINMALNAFQTTVTTRIDDGASYVISLLFFEKSKAEAIAHNITLMTNARNYATDVQVQVENQTAQQRQERQQETQQVVDAIHSLSSRS